MFFDLIGRLDAMRLRRFSDARHGTQLSNGNGTMGLPPGSCIARPRRDCCWSGWVLAA